MMESIAEHDLLKRIIAKNHEVLVIGPSWSIDEDPTLAHACTLAKTVRVIDSRLTDTKLQKALETKYLKERQKTRDEIRRLHLESNGAGSFNEYLASMKMFQTKTLTPLVEPELFYENILHADLGQNTTDVILDRGTSEYTTQANVALPGAWSRRPASPKEVQTRVELIAEKYHRALGKGGKIIMMFRTLTGESIAKKFIKAFENHEMRLEPLVISRSPYQIGSTIFPISRKYAIAFIAHKE